MADLDKESAFYRQAHEYRVLVAAPSHMRLVETESIFFNGHDERLLGGIELTHPFSHVLTNPLQLGEIGLNGELLLETAHDILTADAGFEVFDTSVTIGGRWWQDSNLDGVQQSSETAEPGRYVLLWEYVDGEWQQAEDLDGNHAVVTDQQGDYRFRVSPTHYDEHDERFLQPREYRVSAEREGHEQWSPYRAGDDARFDSDVLQMDAEGDSQHTGVAGVFDIADLTDGTVDLATVRDDLYIDLGIKTYDTQVRLGGIVWLDTDEDGETGADEPVLAGTELTLWERIDGEWLTVEDLTGASTVLSDSEGRYEFTVQPTHYDAAHAGYLQPREYRVTMQLPEGYELSGGAVDVTLEEATLRSRLAVLGGHGDDGSFDIAQLQDDTSLHFALVKVEEPVVIEEPDDEPVMDDEPVVEDEPVVIEVPQEEPSEEGEIPLPQTGSTARFGLAVALLALGAALIAGGLRKTRRHPAARSRRAL